MRSIYLIIVYLTFLPLVAKGESADTILLSVKPDKCVALHKGQDCYQTVSFRWKTPAKGHFCLLEVGREQPLKCWDGQTAKSMKYEFAFAQTQTYQLVSREPKSLLQEIDISVNWVYTSKKRVSNGWRLF